MTVSVGYLVHDLGDSAVARRIRMMAAAGASVSLAGFSRRDPPAAVEGVPATVLARTGDGRLVQRAAAVVENMLRSGKARAAVGAADILLARNLEMLAIAARLRRPGQRLVYECLDIHRMMLGDGAQHRAMRAIEKALLRRCDLVVTSAPAFVEHYFHRLQHHDGPIRLVENKVLALDADDAVPRSAKQAAGPPWRIGWFGMLRCRRTLDMLSQIVRAGQGRIEVLIAGKPSPAEFTDFDAQVAAVPGMHYAGPYAPGDLPWLYGQVHFAWCVDFFEEGLNASWLLPNRLYEGLAFGAVPVTMPGIAIADWLQAAGCGIVMEDLVAGLPPFLATLDDAGYRALTDAVAAVPDDRLLMRRPECDDLLEAMEG